MTEERITETRTPSGDTHTTHTIVNDDGRRSSSGAWVPILLLVVLAVVGIWFFTQQSGAEVAKDNAIAGAAEQVGNAAGQVGDAAQNAGEAIEGATNGN